ncbi:hypothetical protein [Mycobacterium palustre]|uniref:HK97 gp10 family phage protein n=1 Tax=Mycobacterium palustre TaxID=153971 RepID=A0A1X1ZCM8_9MYCO|nr:hypothetical protein [Mycobacterium palustre]ORW20911.1 hypothetical protein AWC19_14180 [Mycobacterium palustre]
MSKYGFEEAAGVSDAEIEAAIASDAKIDAELNKFMADEVVPYWRSQTPILKSEPGDGKRRAGAARASVQVTKRARGGKGQVGMKIWYAGMLEHGTGGSTPTPQFAPGAKTAAHFGGTLDEAAHGGNGAGGKDRRRRRRKRGRR